MKNKFLNRFLSLTIASTMMLSCGGYVMAYEYETDEDPVAESIEIAEDDYSS